MTRTIKAFYIDPESNTAEVRTIEDKLDTFYDLLRCRCIDIVTRKIGIRGRAFNIICDDEGTFSDDPKISAIDNLGRVMLVGALLIVGQADEDGNLTSLTSNDVALIKRYVTHLGTRLHPEGWKMLTTCEYCY